MKVPFFLILALAATTLSAQSDPEHPAPLQSNVLEVTTHGDGGNSYYQLAAGPGDVTISVQASTDYYSSPLEIELLSGEGKSIGSIDVVATDSVGRASRTFRLPARDGVVLKVATQNDSHVKWLKYRIALKGSIDLQTPAPVASVALTTSTVASADPAPVVVPNPLPATPSASPIALPAAGAEGDLGLDMLAQLLDSIPSLPSSGTLRIDMKDGTFRLVPLAKVLRLSVVRPK